MRGRGRKLVHLDGDGSRRELALDVVLLDAAPEEGVEVTGVLYDDTGYGRYIRRFDCERAALLRIEQILLYDLRIVDLAVEGFALGLVVVYGQLLRPEPVERRQLDILETYDAGACVERERCAYRLAHIDVRTREVQTQHDIILCHLVLHGISLFRGASLLLLLACAAAVDNLYGCCLGGVAFAVDLD